MLSENCRMKIKFIINICSRYSIYFKYITDKVDIYILVVSYY